MAVAWLGCNSNDAARSKHQRSIEQCAAASVEIAFSGPRASEPRPLSALISHPSAHQLACADVYRQDACGDAWRNLFAKTPSADLPLPAVGSVLEACMTAYCSALDDSDEVCQPIADYDSVEHNELVSRLAALDERVLLHDGVAEELATALAGRIRIFEVYPVEKEVPGLHGLTVNLPQGESRDIDRARTSIVVGLAPSGQITVNGQAVSESDLDQVFQRAYAADQDTQVLIQAGADASHGQVVSLMERAKSAGLTRLAVATRAPATD